MLVLEAVKHRELLIKEARYIVGDAAEDVVSDLTEYFLRGRFNAPEKCVPLLIWYVKRRAISYKLKKKNEREKIQYIEVDDTTRELDYCPDKAMESLNNLDPLITKILVTHYMEGVPLVEISRQTGIDLNRLHYLRRCGANQIRNEQRD